MCVCAKRIRINYEWTFGKAAAFKWTQNGHTHTTKTAMVLSIIFQLELRKFQKWKQRDFLTTKIRLYRELASPTDHHRSSTADLKKLRLQHIWNLTFSFSVILVIDLFSVSLSSFYSIWKFGLAHSQKPPVFWIFRLKRRIQSAAALKPDKNVFNDWNACFCQVPTVTLVFSASEVQSSFIAI